MGVWLVLLAAVSQPQRPLVDYRLALRSCTASPPAIGPVAYRGRALYARLVDHSIRRILPLALEAEGHADAAARVRGLAPIDGAKAARAARALLAPLEEAPPLGGPLPPDRPVAWAALALAALERDSLQGALPGTVVCAALKRGADETIVWREVAALMASLR